MSFLVIHAKRRTRFEISGQRSTSQAYWVTLALKGLNSVNLATIKKQKLKCKNSYSYVATATTIRFNSQFPRSPDAAFGGLIGWLFNRKCKFSCRIMSNIANCRKHNYFSDVDGIDIVTLRLWKFSDVSSRHTAGIAGDDIMFLILVAHVMIMTYALNPVIV